MEIKVHDQDNVYIVDLIGEFDFLNAEEIKTKIITLINQGIKKCIINFDGVEYLDSTGIGTLISTWTKAKEQGVNLKFTNVKGSVKKVIELSRLHLFLPLAATIEEALKDI